VFVTVFNEPGSERLGVGGNWLHFK